jgi:hypothetical protein
VPGNPGGERTVTVAMGMGVKNSVSLPALERAQGYIFTCRLVILAAPQDLFFGVFYGVVKASLQQPHGGSSVRYSLTRMDLASSLRSSSGSAAEAQSMSGLARLELEFDGDQSAKAAMIEQQIEMEIGFSGAHTFLPRDESEARPRPFRGLVGWPKVFPNPRSGHP